MLLLIIGYKKDHGFHIGYSPSFSLSLLLLGEASCHGVRQPCGVACVNELENGSSEACQLPYE